MHALLQHNAPRTCHIAVNVTCRTDELARARTVYTVAGVAMKQMDGDSAFYYKSDLDVDADGSPNAYNPENTGIDYLGSLKPPAIISSPLSRLFLFVSRRAHRFFIRSTGFSLHTVASTMAAVLTAVRKCWQPR